MEVFVAGGQVAGLTAFAPAALANTHVHLFAGSGAEGDSDDDEDELEAADIGIVVGDLVVDVSHFPPTRTGPGWPARYVPGDVGPMSGLMIDDNQHRGDAAYVADESTLAAFFAREAGQGGRGRGRGGRDCGADGALGLRDVAALFDLIDADGSGRISFSEFARMVRLELRLDEERVPKLKLQGLWRVLDENESGFFRRDSRKSAKKDSWMMTDKGRKHFGAPQKFIKKSPAKSNKKTTGKSTK